MLFRSGIRGVGCYVNDTGKLIGLCPNLLILDTRGRWCDVLVGCAVFFGISGDIEVSLSDKQIAKVMDWIREHSLIATA